LGLGTRASSVSSDPGPRLPRGRGCRRNRPTLRRSRQSRQSRHPHPEPGLRQREGRGKEGLRGRSATARSRAWIGMRLVAGKRGSGKTTELFRISASVCASSSSSTGLGDLDWDDGSRGDHGGGQEGGRVLFLCNRERLESDPPEHVVEAWQASRDDAFSGIQMRYVTDELDLKRVISCLHLIPPSKRPSSLVVDDIDLIMATKASEEDENKNKILSLETRLARCLAYLQNASTCLSRPASVVASITLGSEEDLQSNQMHIYRRYFASIQTM